MLADVRAFFAQRNVLEVDCPSLSQAAPIDLHIEVMQVTLADGRKRYLHTSPEYGMKRLLSLNIGDIYQLSHVFRAGEIGRLHNPEFTLIEWYRTHFSFEAFIQESVELIQLFLGPLAYQAHTYRDIFYQITSIDSHTATPQILENYLTENGVSLSQQEAWDKDSYLNLIMTFIVEPHLQGLSLVTEFPASQSALAQVKPGTHGELVAERFEFYYQGIELGNGYHELTDPGEQRRRFIETNQKRLLQGKEPLPMDEHFIAALEQGLPDCYGIAMGFDRLFLLRHQKNDLGHILPFYWDIS